MLLTELIKVINKDAILQAKEKRERVQIAWDNGIIQVGTSQLTHSFSSLYIVLDFANNLFHFWPMDDRSDFRFIKRVQQAASDLIKSNIIDKNWKVQLADKNGSKQNLGGTKIDDLINYDANFTKNIKQCFHGTSDVYLNDIKSLGLVPINQLEKLKGINYQQNHGKFYTEDSPDQIYLTIDYNQAEGYAQHAAEQVGGKPIVIVINDLPIENVTADDDIINNVGFAQLLSKLQGRDSKYKTYIDGIRANSQFAVNGRIQPKYIFKVIKVKS